MSELVIKNLHVRVEDTEILNGVDLTIKSGEVHAVMGPNGTGKSTFLNVITKAISADSGTIEWGQTIKIGYYRQEGITFKDDETVSWIDYKNQKKRFDAHFLEFEGFTCAYVLPV